jgi:glyoxylase-like metal-dependent hydrolase (beta-lactamase superfamily II)
VGSAGFLLKRFDVPLYMAATEYLQCLNLQLDLGALEATHYRRFYLDHGLDEDTTQRVVTGGHAYLKLISGLSPVYHRLAAGDVLRVGPRSFDVLTGGGHSPEQIMLLCRADKLFFAADQVLAKISPNVSVNAIDPEGDPLGYYLRSLKTLRRDIAADVLVLPGHNLPFYGLHTRIEELIKHHEARCELILQACRAAPRSAAELVPVLFTCKLDPHQLGFAFTEVLAHVLHAGKWPAQAGHGPSRYPARRRRVTVICSAAQRGCRPAYKEERQAVSSPRGGMRLPTNHHRRPRRQQRCAAAGAGNAARRRCRQHFRRRWQRAISTLDALRYAAYPILTTFSDVIAARAG